MIFLAVMAAAIGTLLAVAPICFLFKFWFDFSDGEWWGLAAFFVSGAAYVGAFAQVVVWLA